MRRNLVLGALALSAAALIAGCFAQTGAHAGVDAPVVFSEEPTLVVVEPGVWVVRDYDYAVYYVDDYYWVYRDDVWHRSQSYDGGWATVEVSSVPRLIVSRDQHAYVHYRGAPNAPTRKPPRAGGDDHDLRERADDQRAVPPAREQDKEPRPPEHPDDRHDSPPGRDKKDDPRPAEHPGDRAAPPKHDDRSGVNPADGHGDKRDSIKPEEHEKRDEKKRDDKGKPDKDNHKRAEKKDERDKK